MHKIHTRKLPESSHKTGHTWLPVQGLPGSVPETLKQPL